MFDLSKQIPVDIGCGIEVKNYSFDPCSHYTADYAYNNNFRFKLSHTLLSRVLKIVKIV